MAWARYPGTMRYLVALAVCITAAVAAHEAQAHHWSVGVYFSPGPYPQGAQSETLVAVITTDKSGEDRTYYNGGWPGGDWWYPMGTLDPDPNAAGGFGPYYPVALGTVYAWPSSWEQPTFEWVARTHVCTEYYAADGNRTYVNQDASFSVNPWTATHQAGLGVQRYYCRVTWEGTTHSSGVDRVSVVSNDSFGITGNDADSMRRRAYLQWLFSYLNVPYEYGGCWYGGKTGTRVGGGGAYDGYGVDCSGLVSCGAKWAGYNWHTGTLFQGWRYNTTGLLSVTTGTFPPEDPFGAADILDCPDVHVVTVCHESGGIIDIVEAAGGDPPAGSIVRYRMGLSLQRDYLDKGYQERRLVYTP